MKPRPSPSFLCGWAKPCTAPPRWFDRRCSRLPSRWRGANMQDRRHKPLKERLLVQTDEIPVIPHLVQDNPPGADKLGGVFRAAVPLDPTSSLARFVLTA